MSERNIEYNRTRKRGHSDIIVDNDEDEATLQLHWTLPHRKRSRRHKCDSCGCNNDVHLVNRFCSACVLREKDPVVEKGQEEVAVGRRRSRRSAGSVHMFQEAIDASTDDGMDTERVDGGEQVDVDGDDLGNPVWQDKKQVRDAISNSSKISAKKQHVELHTGRQGGSGKAKRQRDIMSMLDIGFQEEMLTPGAGGTPVEWVIVLVDVSAVCYTVLEEACRTTDLNKNEVRELVQRCLEVEKANTELRIDIADAKNDNRLRYVLCCDVKPEMADEEAQSISYGTHLRRIEGTMVQVEAMQRLRRDVSRKEDAAPFSAHGAGQGHRLCLTGQAHIAMYHAAKHLSMEHQEYEFGNELADLQNQPVLADQVKDAVMRVYDKEEDIAFIITLHDSDWGFNQTTQPVYLLHPTLGTALVQDMDNQLMSLAAAMLLSSDIQATVRPPSRNLLSLDTESLRDLLEDGDLLTHVYASIVHNDLSVATLLRGTSGKQPASEHMLLLQQHALHYLRWVKLHLQVLGFDDDAIERLTSLHAWGRVFDGDVKDVVVEETLPEANVLGAVHFDDDGGVMSLLNAFVRQFAVEYDSDMSTAHVLPAGEVCRRAGALTGSDTLSTHVLHDLRESTMARWECQRANDKRNVHFADIDHKDRHQYKVSVDTRAIGMEGLVAAAQANGTAQEQHTGTAQEQHTGTAQAGGTAQDTGTAQAQASGTAQAQASGTAANYTCPSMLYSNMVNAKRWTSLCTQYLPKDRIRKSIASLRGVLHPDLRQALLKQSRLVAALEEEGVDMSKDVFVGATKDLASILGATPPSVDESQEWQENTSAAIDRVFRVHEQDQDQGDGDGDGGVLSLDDVIDTILPDNEQADHAEWSVFFGLTTPNLDETHAEYLASSSCIVELGSMSTLRNKALVTEKDVSQLIQIQNVFGVVVAIQRDLLQCAQVEPDKTVEGMLSRSLVIRNDRLYLRPPDEVSVVSAAGSTTNGLIAANTDLILQRQQDGCIRAEYVDGLDETAARAPVHLEGLPAGVFSTLCNRAAAHILTSWRVMLTTQANDNLADLVVAASPQLERKDVVGFLTRHANPDDDGDDGPTDTTMHRACKRAVEKVLLDVGNVSLKQFSSLRSLETKSPLVALRCFYELAKECNSTRKLYGDQHSFEIQLAAERELIFGRWATTTLARNLLRICGDKEVDLDSKLLAWSVLCGAATSLPGGCSDAPPPQECWDSTTACHCGVHEFVRGARRADNQAHVHAMRASLAWHMMNTNQEEVVQSSSSSTSSSSGGGGGSSRRSLFASTSIQAMHVCAQTCVNKSARVVTYEEGAHIADEELGAYADALLFSSFNVYDILSPTHAARVAKTPFFNDGFLSVRLFSNVHMANVRHWTIPSGADQRRLFMLEHLLVPHQRLSLFPTLRACINLLRNPTATSYEDTERIDDADLLQFLRGDYTLLEDAPEPRPALSAPFVTHSIARYNYSAVGKVAAKGKRGRDSDAHTEEQQNTRRLLERVAAVAIRLCQVGMLVASHEHQLQPVRELADGDGDVGAQTKAVHALLHKWLPHSAGKLIALGLCPRNLEHSRRPHGVVSSFSRLLALSQGANQRLQFLGADPGIANAPSALCIPLKETVQDGYLLQFATAWRFSPPSLGAMERKVGLKKDNATLSRRVRERMQELRVKRAGLFAERHSEARVGRTLRHQCRALTAEEASSAVIQKEQEEDSQSGDRKTHHRREQKNRIRKMREHWLAQVRATEKMQLEKGQLRRITLLCIGDGFKGGRGGVKKLEELAKHNMIVVRVNECNTTLRCPTCGSVHESKHGNARTARVKYCTRCKMHRNRDFASAQAIANKVYAALRGHTIWCMTKVWQRSQIGRAFRSKIGLPENVDGEAQNLEANSSAG